MSEHRDEQPSLMTAREKVEHAVAVGNLPETAGLTERLAAYEMDREQAQDPRRSAAEKARRLAEIDAALHPDVDALVERAALASARELDREESELRMDAGFGAEVDSGVGARAVLMSTQVAASDPNSAIDTFADAGFTGNADLIRTVAPPCSRGSGSWRQGIRNCR